MKITDSGSWLSLYITEGCDLLLYSNCLHNLLDKYFSENIKDYHRVLFNK